MKRFLRNSGDPAKPLDSYVNVVTPENIGFKYRVAGPHLRFLAFFLDGLILLAVFITLFIGLVLVTLLFESFFAATGIGSLLEDVGNMLVAWWLVVTWAIWWGYSLWFEAQMNGQTLGKRLLGLRVTSTDGRPINGMQAVGRNLIRFADMYPYFTMLAIYTWLTGDLDPDMITANVLSYPAPTCLVALCFMMLTRRRQRLGDLVCGTMVVNEERKHMADIAVADDPRTSQLAEYIPPGFIVSGKMAKALAHYVDRRRFFSPARRAEIAKHLGEPLLRKFNMRPDTSHDLILCALYYRTFLASDQEQESKNGPSSVPSPEPPPYPNHSFPNPA